MRALVRLLFAASIVAFLAGCGSNTSTQLRSGQSFALAPDLTVRLTASRPTLTQLKLQIRLLPAGETPVQALVPDVVVIPSGGREISSTLDFQQAGALITMLMEDAQQVGAVTVRDVRTGHSVDWLMPSVQALFPCKTSNDCELIGLPQGQSLPSQP